jgi:hypothetical protein
MNPAVVDVSPSQLLPAAVRRLTLSITSHQPDLFFVHHGAGSEEWKADGFTRST